MRVKQILLDFDGPLLDGRFRHYQCYADILQRHGYQPMPIEQYWSMKRRRASRVEQLAVSDATSLYDVFLQEWIESIEDEHYLALDQLQAGVIAVLQRWQRESIAIALVTMRAHQDRLIRQLEALALLPYLSPVIVCQHSLGGSGKAEAVRSNIDALEPAACLWIGDTEADAEAARHLGCPVALLSCGLRTSTYLASLNPDAMYQSLCDIPHLLRDIPHS